MGIELSDEMSALVLYDAAGGLEHPSRNVV